MPENALQCWNDVLDRIALGTHDEQLSDAISRLFCALPLEGEAAEKLGRQLVGLSRSLRDAGLSERGLNLLIETTHDLSGTLSLEDLLRKIVARARSLVAANIAWLTILDEEDGIFRMVATEGHLSPATAEMSSRYEYGVVGLIMQRKASSTRRTIFPTRDFAIRQSWIRPFAPKRSPRWRASRS